MEEEVTEMEQEIIITKNNPLLHFSGSKKMQRCVESDNAQNINLGLRARSWFLRKALGLWQYPIYKGRFSVSLQFHLRCTVNLKYVF